MGSQFNTYEPGEDTDIEQIKIEFAAHQEDCCYEGGRDAYAGHLGIKNGLRVRKDKIFEDLDAAVDWIDLHNCKWDAADCVPYKSKVTGYDAASRKIVNQIARLKKELDEFDATIVKELKKAKSKTIGCKRCGSSINRKYLDALHCPICNKMDAFCTSTNKKRFERLKAKIQTLKDKPLVEKKVNGVRYVIGGNCSC